MLKRLHLRDFVIVRELELELGAGFTVLTGETGAGKSILVDALQLALGGRSDAGVVREGAKRSDITAEFDLPTSLKTWLVDAGFEGGTEARAEAETEVGTELKNVRNTPAPETLLLRRVVDAQGKSRAWVNGSSATLAQLREAAEHLVDIHGQHAWQSLTRPAAVRNLLDSIAGLDTAPLAQAWARWRTALQALEHARGLRDSVERERERLQWQLSELLKLAPGAQEWPELNAEHQRLAHAQALLDAARTALLALSDAEPSAESLLARAVDPISSVAEHDAELASLLETLRSAQAQVQDATHTLNHYLGHNEPDPRRLAELDARLSDWIQLARRYRRQPQDLPDMLLAWQIELRTLDAAADLDALAQAAAQLETAWRQAAKVVSQQRKRAAPKLGAAVTAAMQNLGMKGGEFEVALLPCEEPQSWGLETVEFRVAGHAGATPRPLGKVASGGELSRLALAIAVSTAPGVGALATSEERSTLIFDEIDAGVGGTVADSVGRLMKQLGGSSQVLAVTHLAQVAACADAHLVVAKALKGSATLSDVQAVSGEARVSEIARMLGGGQLGRTSRAHAQALLGDAA